jgi:heptosyltransferase-3
MTPPGAAYGGYPELDAVRRVLVVKLRHHGDVLLASPVFSALKRAIPEARIDAYVNRETLPMLEGHPAIHGFVTLDRAARRRGLASRVAEELRVLRAIRSARYDLVVNLTEGDRGRIAARVSGARIRVGFAPRGRRVRGYTHEARRPVTMRHAVEQNLDALRRIGIFPENEARDLHFAIPEAARQSVTRRLADAGLRQQGYVLVHPASRWLFKCWPEDKVAALVDALSARGLPVVMTAAPDAREKAMVERILARTTRSHVLDLSGQVSLKELGVLIDAAACLVTVDSVPMHIASALKRPVVALFGPSSEVEWGPWRNPDARVVTWHATCRPCGLDGCGGSKVSDCLVQIPVTAVLAAVESLVPPDMFSS